MKVSVCITYFNRKQLLKNTLKSIICSKHIDNTEILIVDDASNYENRIEDLIEEYKNFNIKYHRFEPEEKWWKLQIPVHNKLISMATGDCIIQQGAECLHVHDIISDSVINFEKNMYKVYACYALSEKSTSDLNTKIEKNIIYNYNPVEINFENYNDGIWYQHSRLCPRNFNFCTAILREDLEELGGFDERFSNGYAYGDNEFVARINRKKMKITPIDNLYVFHQFHHREPHNQYDVNYDLLQKIDTESLIKVHNSFKTNI